LAMILTALRYLEGEVTELVTPSHLHSNTLVCSDQDYETAMSIVTTLEKHAIAVFHNMPNQVLKGKQLAFYDKLPAQLNRQGYLKVAEELGIIPKTAEYYIHLFKSKLIKHDEHNNYTKNGI